MAFEIFTKSIIKDIEQDDQRRISVMSRHTHSDGITPDERIVEGVSFDEWIKDFAPPGKLVGAYYRQEITWKDFAAQYVVNLRTEAMSDKVKKFAKRCTEETITLLCIEDSPDQCHRRLLAEELQRHQPELKIIHK